MITSTPVTIETDHQPLVTILKKPIHAAPARLQWMMLRLQKYNITLVYKCGKEMHLADTLSRAPRSSTVQQPNEEDSFDMMTVSYIPSSCLEELKRHTMDDTTLQTISTIIRHEWLRKRNAIRPYFPFRDELTIKDGVIMKGHNL